MGLRVGEIGLKTLLIKQIKFELYLRSQIM